MAKKTATTAEKTTSESFDFSRARIERVKYLNEKMLIVFSLETSLNTRATFTLTSEDQPDHFFMKALVSLQTALAQLCEVSMSSDNQVVVTGVVCKYVEENIQYKLTGKRSYQHSRGVLALVSPLKWIEHADEKQQLDEATAEHIAELIHQAGRYLAGARSQLSLFGSEASTTKVTETGELEEEEELAA